MIGDIFGPAEKTGRNGRTGKNIFKLLNIRD